MSEGQKLDIVFVVCSSSGNSSNAIDTTISRVSQHLIKFHKDCRFASIHFKQEYNSGAGRNIFCSHVSDFSNGYCDAKVNSGNPLQYGYPLQHVANLSFRHDATKISFLISNVLPFFDSCEETVIYKNELQCTTTNSETSADNITGDWSAPNNQNQSTSRQTKDVTNIRLYSHQFNSNVVYHEDPLKSCSNMAALGVVLYCIETVPYSMQYKDLYDALCYITGGQCVNVHQSQLAKAIKATILEEVSLEHLVGYIRDYLCVAWLAWGTMKAKKPSNHEELTENVLNYLHKVNITKREILIDNTPLKPPSKYAKKLTTLTNIAEARRMTERDDNWAAEISWLMPEICNEVIPGYDTPAAGKFKKRNIKKVKVSKYKRVSKTQVERVIVRTLARKITITSQEQQWRAQTMCNNENDIRIQENEDVNSIPVGNLHEVEHSTEYSKRTMVEEVASIPEKGLDSGIHSKWKIVSSCKQELLADKLTEKCTAVTCKNCVVV